MKHETNGRVDVKIGEEKLVWFDSKVTGKKRLQYDYRHLNGELFSCVAKSLTDANKRRDAWIKAQTGPTPALAATMKAQERAQVRTATDEFKPPLICPIRPDRPACSTDACAWYSSRAGRCAVLSICEIMFSKSVTGGL